MLGRCPFHVGTHQTEGLDSASICVLLWLRTNDAGALASQEPAVVVVAIAVLVTVKVRVLSGRGRGMGALGPLMGTIPSGKWHQGSVLLWGILSRREQTGGANSLRPDSSWRQEFQFGHPVNLPQNVKNAFAKGTNPMSWFLWGSNCDLQSNFFKVISISFWLIKVNIYFLSYSHCSSRSAFLQMNLFFWKKPMKTFFFIMYKLGEKCHQSHPCYLPSMSLHEGPLRLGADGPVWPGRLHPRGTFWTLGLLRKVWNLSLPLLNN